MDGCDVKGTKGWGFCERHYRQYQHGSLDINGNWLKQRFKKKCQVSGCENQKVASEYCLEHYRNKMLGQDIEKNKSSDEKYKGLIEKTNIIAEIKIHKKHIEEYELKVLPDEFNDNFEGDSFCKVKRCKKKEKTNGFCGAHYYHYKNGNLDVDGNWMNGVKEYKYKTCQIVGCENKHWGKGLCSKHLKLATRGQIAIKGFDLSGYKKCKVDGCERIVESKVFCPAHNYRYKEGFIDINGKWLKETIRDRNELDIETCLVGGCNDKHLAKGLCQKHYSVYIRRCNEEWLRQKFFSNKEFVCADCGKPYLFCQIDFHHLRDKTINFGNEINSSTFTERPEIIEELNKGIWLCSKCHTSRNNNYNLTFYEDRVDKGRGINIDRAYKLITEKYGYNCNCCGDVLLPKEIEFHHNNPEEKEYNLSGQIGWQKFETLCEEIDKCDIVCRNCHRLIHYVEFGNSNLSMGYFTKLFELNGILN